MTLQALRSHFFILSRFGVWLPVEWSTGWRKSAYKIYGSFVTVMLYSMLSSQLIGTFSSVGRINDLIDSIYTCAAVFNVGWKIFNLLKKHGEIIKILALLEDDLCTTKSPEEEEIQNKCNQRIRSRMVFLVVLFESTGICLILSSIFKNIPERSLPLKAWLPFDYTVGYRYWLVYTHQVIGLIYVGIIHPSYDAFIVGVMLSLCGQLQIIQYRNTEMALLNNQATATASERRLLEKKFIANSVRHHQILQQFAEGFNDIILYVIFVQYSISSFITCVTAYKLVSLKVDDPDFIFTVMYCAAMVIQTFLYCWYGNEVMCESTNISNSLYSSNWYSLNAETVRDVTLMMLRMQESIKFSCSRLFILSVESFKNIMKVTYSTFSVLKS